MAKSTSIILNKTMVKPVKDNADKCRVSVGISNDKGYRIGTIEADASAFAENPENPKETVMTLSPSKKYNITFKGADAPEQMTGAAIRDANATYMQERAEKKAKEAESKPVETKEAKTAEKKEDVPHTTCIAKSVIKPVVKDGAETGRSRVSVGLSDGKGTQRVGVIFVSNKAFTPNKKFDNTVYMHLNPEKDYTVQFGNSAENNVKEKISGAEIIAQNRTYSKEKAAERKAAQAEVQAEGVEAPTDDVEMEV